MRFATLVIAFSSIANVYTQSLSEVIAGDTELSSLAYLFPDLNSSLGLSTRTNFTLLAPSNDAVNRVVNTTFGPALAADSDLLNALFSYHVVLGNYSSFGKTTFAATALESRTYSNVTGGQRVEALPSGSGKSTTFYSGLNQNASLISSKGFDGGTIHVIDEVLTVPQNFSASLTALNLSSALASSNFAGLTYTADTAADTTFFVPSNAAFAKNGSLANMSSGQLSSLLQFHVVAGRVLYSSEISDNARVNSLTGTLTTWVDSASGAIFLNSARVIRPNVLITNGVVHVIDQILDPANLSTTRPNFTDPGDTTDTSGVTLTDDSKGLSTGAKAAIGVVVPLVVISAILAVLVLLRRRRAKKRATVVNAMSESTEKPELEGSHGQGVLGKNGSPYSKAELGLDGHPSTTMGRNEAEGDPMRHEAEGDRPSAAELRAHERYELEAHNDFSVSGKGSESNVESK